MIRIKGMTVAADGREILSGLSLRVAPGEKLLIRGASGSGKSTLLRAMLFFEPFTGEVLFDGVPVSADTLAVYRSRIAFLGQRIPPYAGSAAQVLDLPWTYRANRGHAPDPARRIRLLANLRLDDALLARPFETLSGGEKQRLLLVQTLLLGRGVLLLDEPTAGLDHANRLRVIRLLCGLSGVTLVAVSHDPEWAAAADRCLTLAGGRLQRGRCLVP